MGALVEKLGLTRYSLYVMDYGAPIGYRLTLRHPGRVQALIVQNGNAYDEGLREFWNPIKKYWSDPTTENRRPSASWLTQSRPAGNMKTAWLTTRWWIQPPGPWIIFPPEDAIPYWQPLQPPGKNAKASTAIKSQREDTEVAKKA